MAKYQLYTDGSADKDGFGGWAFFVTQDDQECFRKSGQEENTTCNRMELTAVIEGLKMFDPTSAEVEVLSDSAYVVNCFKDKWYVNWRKYNWIGSKGPVKNRDLWEILLASAEKFKHPIKWTHVKGHSGQKFNELCDRFASKARGGNVDRGTITRL